MQKVQLLGVCREVRVVDVPRFELGASSMPRKRASRLRHTPSGLATLGGHLRRTGGGSSMEREDGGQSQPPAMPAGLLEGLKEELGGEDAPFLRHLDGHLDLEWLPAGETRLGVTRFECNHNELYRRRRLKASPGPVTIALNPVLSDDEALFGHTLAHELLHAAGLLDHDGLHTEIVKRVAPAPRLDDSPVLRRLRQEVLSGLPEGQWICGNCGYAWERRRVTRPTRCPKCARPFKA